MKIDPVFAVRMRWAVVGFAVGWIAVDGITAYASAADEAQWMEFVGVCNQALYAAEKAKQSIPSPSDPTFGSTMNEWNKFNDFLGEFCYNTEWEEVILDQSCPSAHEAVQIFCGE